MIAGLLKVLIKLLVVAATAAMVMTFVGASLRQLVPEAYHRALWLTGLCISLSCAAGVLLLATSAAARPRLQNLLLVGVAIGGLLCLLFITGIDCKLTQSYGRSPRLDLSCRDVE